MASGTKSETRGAKRLLAPLGESVYLAVGAITAAAAGGALFWLAMWILYDYLPALEDTLGAVLAETSRGLFTGAGLMAALVVLRALRAIGHRFSKR